MRLLLLFCLILLVSSCDDAAYSPLENLIRSSYTRTENKTTRVVLYNTHYDSVVQKDGVLIHRTYIAIDSLKH